MPSEIERKFLVQKELWTKLKKPEGEIYKQGYILTEPAKTIRVRMTESNAYLTIKGETRGISRAEYEYKIPVNEAVEILNLFAGNVIEKTRYKILYKGKTWEVDVFAGKNEGLILAEIELESEDEKFETPSWIAKEVTGIEKYYNSYLSVYPYQNWENKK